MLTGAAPIAPREICGTFTGYQAERMAMQGIEEVRAKHTVCRAEGGATCRWELDWKSRRANSAKRR